MRYSMMVNIDGLFDKFAERLDKFTNKSDGCWLWTGRVHKNNKVGEISVSSGFKVPVHRLALMIRDGLIEFPREWLVAQHCGNKLCVKPEHLYIRCTLSEHTKMLWKDDNYRKLNRGRIKTSCKRGHPFTIENTYIYRNVKRCRICKDASRKAYIARKRDKLCSSTKDT
jgi:hypothetical protein